MHAIDTNKPVSSDTAEAGERRYPYAPGYFAGIAGLLFFGGGGLLMGHAAANNQRGLVIDAIIHLSPEHASDFYLLISAGCFAFVFVLLIYTLPQNFISRCIILSDEAITLPGAGFDTAHYKFAPSQIVTFKITVARNRRFLKIYTADRSFAVNPMWLREPAAFAEIVSWLHSHVQRQSF